MDSAAWGVAGSYRDARDRPRRISRRAQAALLAAMGAEPGAVPPPSSVTVGAPGQPLPRPGELRLEDGTALGQVDALPADLPFGYHDLDGQLLLIAPPRCHLPRGLRTWGWAVQLYAARSAGSWGHGDLADLRLVAQTAQAQGAGFVLVSPTWAPAPGAAEPEPSPYFPSSRRFASPLYLRVEEVPGAEALGTDLVRLSAAGRALNGSRRIDRAAVAELKSRALTGIWEASGRPGLPAGFRAAAGNGLRRWATFATLSEELGADWRRWPAAYRDPAARGVAEFARGHVARVAFHEWVQWALDLQRERAGATTRIVTDLPIGTDPAGFDAWEWQADLATGVSLGVPPDRFNAAGQDWGLPAIGPHRLRAARYRPFIETLRAALRHAGGLRIDHVLGLFRQWWVPAGAGPTEGGYVRFPSDELLAICAIESHRARALIIGEDLGTVPRGVRSRLARANVLSTRLLYFERRPPATYPRRALAAVTTHDLPTVRGVWTGADLAAQAAAGLDPDVEGMALLRRRLADAAGVPAAADPADVVLGAHAALAASPAALVVATLEDALLVAERPNDPRTTDGNWSRALPSPIETLRTDAFVARLAAALRRDGVR
ncbi:MAG TPA: 4-alpha-glucanotransferase [Candidatus Limnocylindria bacterium]|nr:4-alpha-glucanotransferase [Candidatus Limnocylindria bacterium]